jgi:hypothetical protein
MRCQLPSAIDLVTAGTGGVLREPVLAGGGVHPPQHVPVGETADQRGVLGWQAGGDVIDPGRHAFDAHVDGSEDADGDQQAAQVVVRAIRRSGAERVVADFDCTAGHLAQ